MDLTSIAVLIVILLIVWLSRKTWRVWLGVGEDLSIFEANKIGIDMAKKKKALMAQEGKLKEAVESATAFDTLMDELGK